MIFLIFNLVLVVLFSLCFEKVLDFVGVESGFGCDLG